MMKRVVNIHDGWTVEAWGGSGEKNVFPGTVKAEVPGCVHLDLISEGLLPNPNLGDGESRQAWVGRANFRYRRELAPEEIEVIAVKGGRTELVFDSIDTVASIRMNGVEVARSENQFIPVRIPIDHAGGELEVEITSPMDELDRRVKTLGDRPVNADGAWGVYSYLRKSACAFGWDWGPMCPGAGLLGSVRIESYRIARLAGIRPLVTVCTARNATVEVRIDVDRVDANASVLLEAECRLTAPDGTSIDATCSSTEDEITVRIDVPDPQRWWPRGLGEQPLHDLQVILRAGDDLLDEAERIIGLRSVALDLGDENDEGCFALVVNGEKVFCKGANWIPEGLFPGTASAAVVERRVGQAFDAGMNMLRVWGGGLYEQPAFYEACDRLGIMVWQDFMFACATYPEDRPFPELVEHEAATQVTRLAHHPSIMLWCGGNENILAWRNWGWKEKMPAEQAWGRTYFMESLPGVCARLDPSRPYWPDSPFSGSVEADPNDPDVGDRHTWDLKMEKVREMVPRFASEFGHQAPPLRRTIEEAIGAECLSAELPESLDAFAGRQRGWGGDEAQYDQYLQEWFSSPATLDERIAQMHLLQARATSIMLEWLRANTPRCSGALIWQLNDAWAGHSWSLIDVAGRPKPSWWATRSAFGEDLLTVQRIDGQLGLVIVAGPRSGFESEVRVRRMDLEGSLLASLSLAPKVLRGERLFLPFDSQLAATDPCREFLCVDADGHRSTWFHERDLRLEYPAPSFAIQCEPMTGKQGCYRVDLHAESLLRDVIIDPSRVDPTAVVDRNLFTLLPGESIRLEWTGAVELTSTEISRAGVIATANAFGKKKSL